MPASRSGAAGRGRHSRTTPHTASAKRQRRGTTGGRSRSAPEHTLTIDELAAASGVPSRTIRYYQTKGVLSHPSRRGRASRYGSEHVERLQLIGKLQERGLRLDAIRAVARQFEKGGDSIQDWLGLGDHLRPRWSDHGPELLTAAELLERLGHPSRAGQSGRGVIAALEESGLVHRAADHADAYVVATPSLLDLNRRMTEAGIDLRTTLGAERILRRRLSKLADEIVDHFAQRAGRGFGASNTPAVLAEAADALADLGPEAVQLVFTQELQRSLLRFVERGGDVAPEVSRVGRVGRRRTTRSS